MKNDCSCPNCGSENKQAIGEIMPYKPSGVLMGISLFCMVCGLATGLEILLGSGGEGLIGVLIPCLPIFIYGTYAFLRYLCRPKHLIKYLCLDCNCQYFVEVVDSAKKKQELIKAENKNVAESSYKIKEKLNEKENKKIENTEEKDVFKEVREYKKLLDEGIISEKEFEEKKKSILNIK